MRSSVLSRSGIALLALSPVACAMVWGFDEGSLSEEPLGGAAASSGGAAGSGGDGAAGATTATTTTLTATTTTSTGAGGGAGCPSGCDSPPNALCWEPTGTCDPQTNGCVYTRKPDATPCDATSCGSWGACTWAGECAATGTQSQSCTDYLCANGDCVPSTRQQSQGCSRTVPNGTSCSAGYCCSNQCVSRGSNSHCGSCGVNCAGQSCVAIGGQPGQYSCTCVSNSFCQGAGFGSIATCYATGGQSLCNCQCPNDAASCSGQCAGGGTCADIPGHNYCHY